jgi:hypothetical protein
MAWPTEKKLAFIQALLISDVAELMEENGRLRHNTKNPRKKSKPRPPQVLDRK